MGETVDASEIIHSQLELLEATVRAGHILGIENFLIKGKVSVTLKLAYFCN